MTSLNTRHLLGIRELNPEQINLILDTAESMKEISLRDIKKVPTLRGKTIVHFFHEPSTRTRTSFEIAAKRLSADTVSLSASTSSMSKGETLIDTARNLEAMNPDVVVIRHSSSGVPHMLSKAVSPSIVNAGDGQHEHPTQALLDMLTVRMHKKRLDGLKIALIGDILHSRVARSNIIGFRKMGSRVVLAGPPAFLDPIDDTMGAEVTYSADEAIEGADIIMMLRIQLERQKKCYFPSLREYSRMYGLNEKRVARAKKDVLVMHPGPINRGVEMAPEVADGVNSVILEQVNNGVAVRMAVLYLLLGGSKSENAH